MGERFLNHIIRTLTHACIPVEAGYPAGKWVSLERAVTAVEVRDLDFDQGKAAFCIRVLSPRTLGGWECQRLAIDVLCALHSDGMEGRMGPMEFLQGSDCYCICVDGAMDVAFCKEWYPGKRWEIWCGDVTLENVESFRAVRDQGRRVIGSLCQEEPVGVTPGHGGWEIELVQYVRQATDVQTEPFTLAIRDRDRQITFTGCHWNREEWDHEQRGLRRTRKGFALRREEEMYG